MTLHYLPSEALNKTGTHMGRPCVIPGMTFSYLHGVSYCVRYTDCMLPSFRWVTPSRGHERPRLDINPAQPNTP